MINDGTCTHRFDYDKSGADYGVLVGVFNNPYELPQYNGVLRRIYFWTLIRRIIFRKIDVFNFNNLGWDILNTALLEIELACGRFRWKVETIYVIVNRLRITISVLSSLIIRHVNDMTKKVTMMKIIILVEDNQIS